jgi:hypothetical protein
MRTLHASALILATLALGACGGGGGFEPPAAAPAGNVVPPNATASIANLVNFVDTLPRTETGEPLDARQHDAPGLGHRRAARADVIGRLRRPATAGRRLSCPPRLSTVGDRPSP